MEANLPLSLRARIRLPPGARLTTPVIDTSSPLATGPADCPTQADRSSVDFDLHGIVGVRLIDPSPADTAAVARQLGPIRALLDREPDIVIRFVERLALGPVRLLGVDDAGFTDDAFLVLKGKHKSRTRAQIPLDQVGGPCELVCESGASAVPLLIPIVNLTALAKGVVPLHAAAFVHRGRGVLVTGWAKGGKTESLLAFMANGAQYIGDEWVYVSADGSTLYGIPEPITVWDWHLDDLPGYRAAASRRARARIRAARGVMRLERRRPHGTAAGPSRALRRLMPIVERRASVQLEPERLFGEGRCALRGSFDKLFLGVSHESKGVSVERIDGREVARRMTASLLYERLDLLSAYLKFRFAFPERRNRLIEEAEGRQRTALERAFDGKDAHVVAHPYPAAIPALFQAMEPLI